MSSEAYADYIADAYHGEIGGEAVFGAMAEARSNPEEAHKIRVLERLERETKERLEREMVALGRATSPDAEAVEARRSLGAQLGAAPWLDLIRAMQPELERFVETFRKAEALAPAGREDLARHVTAHEQALLDFCVAELAGEGEKSLDSVEKLLVGA